MCLSCSVCLSSLTVTVTVTVTVRLDTWFYLYDHHMTTELVLSVLWNPCHFSFGPPGNSEDVFSSIMGNCFLTTEASHTKYVFASLFWFMIKFVLCQKMYLKLLILNLHISKNVGMPAAEMRICLFYVTVNWIYLGFGLQVRQNQTFKNNILGSKKLCCIFYSLCDNNLKILINENDFLHLL